MVVNEVDMANRKYTMSASGDRSQTHSSGYSLLTESSRKGNELFDPHEKYRSCRYGSENLARWLMGFSSCVKVFPIFGVKLGSVFGVGGRQEKSRPF